MIHIHVPYTLYILCIDFFSKSTKEIKQNHQKRADYLIANVSLFFA
jgi:hypothetical protein